jgi:Fis family transcriptional regulator
MKIKFSGGLVKQSNIEAINKDSEAYITSREARLSDTMRPVIQRYLDKSVYLTTNNAYDYLISRVEAILIGELMKKYRSNQSKVARILGLSRGTTRKMLKRYGYITPNAKRKPKKSLSDQLTSAWAGYI